MHMGYQGKVQWVEKKGHVKIAASLQNETFDCLNLNSSLFFAYAKQQNHAADFLCLYSSAIKKIEGWTQH